MCSAKLKVRHILFKKIVFLIFLNNHLANYQVVAHCLERKKQRTFFLSKVCLTFNFEELIYIIRRSSRI